jgi:uncharacterized protein (DUF58 family)
VALSGRLVLLGLLGLLLVGYPASVLLVYAALLVVLVVADLVLAAPIAALRLRRDPSPAVRLGQPAQTSVRVTNSGRRRLRARMRDAWVPSAGASPVAQSLAVPAGERRMLRTQLRPTRRGDRPAAALTIRSYGPLGVAARQRRLQLPGSLRVLPPFTSRKFLPEKLARLRQIDGAVVVHQRGQGSEFDSLREYVAGDDVRAIDWRATARSQDVVVRTWRPERDRHIVLAIDTGRTSAARIGNEPRLDAALDACLLLAAVAAKAGDRVALVAADTRLRARLGLSSGNDILRSVVAAVTELEPSLVETDPLLLAGQVIAAAGKRSLVVLFTGLDAGPAETGLMPAARALAARHQVVVASVSDPRVAELAAARGDVADVYTAAAAELTIAARRGLRDRLVQLGCEVVDAPVDVFASRVTDAYLNLKSAGRL